jgi:hypothetical protein
MAIIKPNNNTLSSITALPAAITTGKVLQVVNATYSTTFNTSSTSYADTGLSATITPTSSSNKILIIINQTGLLKETSDNAGRIKLVRGSSEINLEFENDFGRNGSTDLNAVGGTGTSYLDSPATTSATTYKTQCACSVAAAANVRIGQNNAQQTMTLMEIEA